MRTPNLPPVLLVLLTALEWTRGASFAAALFPLDLAFPVETVRPADVAERLDEVRVTFDATFRLGPIVEPDGLIFHSPSPQPTPLAKPASRLPDSVEACLRRANALIAQEKRPDAIPLLLRAQSLKPRDLSLALKIGALLRSPESSAEALEFAQKLTGRFPKSAEAWQLLAAAFRQSGRDEEALAPLQNARRLDPKSAAVLFDEGATLAALRRWDDAAARFVQAVRLDPKGDRFWRGLTECYIAANDLLLGEMKVKQLAEELPAIAPAWYSLGCLQVAGGLRQIGLKSWQKATELRPAYADAWSQIGVLQLQDGDRKGAMDSFQRALKANPRHAEAANNRGWLLLDEGKLDAAIADFQTAIKSDPAYKRAMVNLIRAYTKRGEVGEAEEVCDRLARLDPAAGATMRDEIAR